MSIFSNAATWIQKQFSGDYNPAKSAPPSKPSIIPKAVPVPSAKPPVTATVPTTQGAGGGFSLSNATSIFKDIAGAVESGVGTFFTVKSQYEQIKTAQELEKIKLAAVTSSAKSAPASAQILLPSFADWINNPREAASMVTPAALFGSGAVSGGLSGMTYILGAAAVVWLLVRKK